LLYVLIADVQMKVLQINHLNAFCVGECLPGINVN